jgi:hypothetical protein
MRTDTATDATVFLPVCFLVITQVSRIGVTCFHAPTAPHAKVSIDLGQKVGHRTDGRYHIVHRIGAAASAAVTDACFILADVKIRMIRFMNQTVFFGFLEYFQSFFLRDHPSETLLGCKSRRFAEGKTSFPLAGLLTWRSGHIFVVTAKTMTQGNLVKFLNKFLNPLGRHDSVPCPLNLLVHNDFHRFLFDLVFPKGDRSVNGRHSHQHGDDDIIIVLHQIAQIQKQLTEQIAYFLIPFRFLQFAHKFVLKRPHIKEGKQSVNHDPFAVGLIKNYAPCSEGFDLFVDFCLRQSTGLFELFQGLGFLICKSSNKIHFIFHDKIFQKFNEGVIDGNWCASRCTDNFSCFSVFLINIHALHPFFLLFCVLPGRVIY